MAQVTDGSAPQWFGAAPGPRRHNPAIGRAEGMAVQQHIEDRRNSVAVSPASPLSLVSPAWLERPWPSSRLGGPRGAFRRAAAANDRSVSVSVSVLGTGSREHVWTHDRRPRGDAT